jgi:hypothetical protein
VILFTDGLENASAASRATAVAAIGRDQHPDIAEVFLVFVGQSANGGTALADIASLAGRRFHSLANFSELTQVFLNLVGATP